MSIVPDIPRGHWPSIMLGAIIALLFVLVFQVEGFKHDLVETRGYVRECNPVMICQLCERMGWNVSANVTARYGDASVPLDFRPNVSTLSGG